MQYESGGLEVGGERYDRLDYPYEKHHSTVKDACGLAERLCVKNLLLYHTEDRNLSNRRALYKAEGRRYYHGTLLVPNDLDVIEL